MILLTLMFLNLGGSEVMLILLVILLFFGSKNIPNLARGLGKGMREFREATGGVSGLCACDDFLFSDDGVSCAICQWLFADRTSPGQTSIGRCRRFARLGCRFFRSIGVVGLGSDELRDSWVGSHHHRLGA